MNTSRFLGGLGFVAAVLALVGAFLFPAPAQAAYEDAPYYDIIRLEYDELYPELGPFARIPKESEKYVFDREKLTRTVRLGATKVEDVVIIGKSMNGFYLIDVYEDPFYQRSLQKILESPVTTPDRLVEDFQAAAREQVRTEAFFISGQYPSTELVSINGVPWQETEYRDVVLEQLDQMKKSPYYAGDPLFTVPGYWDIFMNPEYNGLAAEAVARMWSQNGPNNEAGRSVTGVGESGLKLTLTLGSDRVALARDGGTVKVNRLDVPVQAPGGRTLVPLRGVLDEFGAVLEYDGEKKQVTARDGVLEVVLTIGSEVALVNGKEVRLDQPAVIQKGRTLVPLRFVGENLGYTVGWDDRTRQVTIAKP